MDENQEEKIIEEQTEEKQKGKEKMWRIIAVVLSLFLVILLVVWASGSEKFRTLPFFGFLLVIVMIFVSLFWGIGWWRKIQELQEKLKGEGKLPPAITLEQAKQLIEEQLRSPEYADYTTGWIQHRVYNVGKSIKSKVLVVQLKTVYSEAPFQFYIMNLHEPRNMWSFIEQYKYNQGEITRCVNALAIYPEDEPSTTEIYEESPLTGVKRRVVETHREKEEKNKEKEGDFE